MKSKCLKFGETIWFDNDNNINNYLENIKELQSIKILIGLIITNFYLTLEGIFKGNII